MLELPARMAYIPGCKQMITLYLYGGKELETQKIMHTDPDALDHSFPPKATLQVPSKLTAHQPHHISISSSPKNIISFKQPHNLHQNPPKTPTASGSTLQQHATPASRGSPGSILLPKTPHSKALNKAKAILKENQHMADFLRSCKTSNANGMKLEEFIRLCIELTQFLESAKAKGVLQSTITDVTGLTSTTISSLKVCPKKAPDSYDTAAIMGEKGCKYSNILQGKFPIKM